MMSEAVHDVADNSEEFFSAESDTEVSGEREDSQQHEPMTKGSDNGREVDRIQSVNGSKSEPSHAGVPNEDSGANVVQEDSEKDLSAEEIQDRRERAEEIKSQGNQAFKLEDYEGAMTLYTEAIRLCPRICEKELAAVYYGNRAACYVKLNQKEEAAEDCTKSLDLHPSYLKVRIRRAQVYEELEKLEEALKDYQTILEQDPTCHSARAACMRLPQQIEEQREKMKAEMIGKLKELGNTVLKPFGLSTDNFQFQKDPNTGSYSMNFKK
ncbi:tetratricopeptide repeat protein 1-like [Corticium candelabrum]|uniref:tetratricopeptide repeat protein 1-like n=1 Tax=Corticium candelabrum TaxID=121492 RepID=UPI002E274976|nr:tetratricopeptide repeat protein 1-like [Corticium candelabrum]